MKTKVLLILCVTLLLTGCAVQKINEDIREPEVISLDLTGDAQSPGEKAEPETALDNNSVISSGESTPSETYQEIQEQKSDSSMEQSAVGKPDKNIQDLYMQFINNTVVATVRNDYPMNDYVDFQLERGDSYLFAELGQYVNQRYFNPEYSEKTTYDSVQYAFVNSPDSSSNNLLIKFAGLNIYAPDDDSFAVYVLTEQDGQLYLTDEYECWARSGVTAYRSGLCSSSGSSGAGDSYAGIDAIMSDGKITNVYGIEFLTGWWARSVNEAIFNEVFGLDMEPLLTAAIYSIGDNQYYSYGLSECPDDQISLCETFINRCRDEAGVNWITDEEAQTLIKERCRFLNIDYDSIKQQQEPDWVTYNR